MTGAVFSAVMSSFRNAAAWEIEVGAEAEIADLVTSAEAIDLDDSMFSVEESCVKSEWAPVVPFVVRLILALIRRELFDLSCGLIILRDGVLLRRRLYRWVERSNFPSVDGFLRSLRRRYLEPGRLLFLLILKRMLMTRVALRRIL